MRFIDLEELKPRIRAHLDALAQAQKLVTAETDPVKRRALIDKHRHTWTALRADFEEFSNGKCWYVECRNPGTDNDIDHFRPKLGVDEDPNHPGYYWLAFDWHNLRLSCHRANRLRQNPETDEVGGKAAHFPLLNPMQRAYTPDDDLSAEVPTLLDPTDPRDPVILSFKPNGEVDLSPAFKGDAVAEAKFEASRRCLHLNWPRFRDDRVILYNQIDRIVDRVQRMAPANYSASTSAHPSFKGAIRDLCDMIRPQAPYSAAARAYVETFKHDVWWVDAIVLRV